MSRIRWFLVWLAMVAVPLQGLAAASMLFCGPGARQAAGQSAGSPHHAAGQSEHRQGMPAQHDQAQHAGHGSAADADEAVQSPAASLPDASHKCGICAACCHSLAIASAAEPLSFASLPRPGFAEPYAPVHSRSLQVPDKPPRA